MTLPDSRKPIRGRGSADNPPNRFDKLDYRLDQDYADSDSLVDPARPATEFLKDASKTIIAYNDSPDLRFKASLNPYRGCEHGCIYCYARPTHEYLGFSAGLDFETKIVVKERAPELLRRELASPKWTPQLVGVSGVTDPYQPIERRLELTRSCLQVFAEFRNPVIIVTKNHLVTRDIDVLKKLADAEAVAVFLSITTLDRDLTRIMEPRTSTPERRLAAIQTLTRQGIPTGVFVAPVIPGLTDHEMPAIVSAAVQAGARFAGFVPLRLPHGVSEMFEDWLATHMPDRKEKILNRVRAMRDGQLNESRFHERMRGKGPFAEQIKQMFDVACRRNGIHGTQPTLSTDAFTRPGHHQLTLFPESG